MPQRALALLEPSGRWNLRTNSTLHARLATVRAYPAFKLFLAYEKRWWDDKGFNNQPIYHGRSVSDLPIRQTYYLRPDVCEGDGECPSYGLLMASYDDSVAVDFWRGLEPTKEEQRTLDEHLVSMVMNSLPTFGFSGVARNQWIKPPPLHGAPPNMIRHAHQQLAQLHNIAPTQIPEPVYGAYADWTLDPFGGGWHFWEPQIDVQQAMPLVRKPLDDHNKGITRNVYVLGEAYSGGQAWVEGALTTAELVLNDHLGVPKAPWIGDYYLGW